LTRAETAYEDESGLSSGALLQKLTSIDRALCVLDDKARESEALGISENETKTTYREI